MEGGRRKQRRKKKEKREREKERKKRGKMVANSPKEACTVKDKV